MTNCERTRSCAFAVALIRLFLWTLLRKIQNQHSSCFIFRLDRIIITLWKDSITDKNAEPYALSQQNSIRQHFRQKFMLTKHKFFPLMKRIFAFTVYDAPMLHHGLNIIVKHMAVL